MGNIAERMASNDIVANEQCSSKTNEPVETFQFHDSFVEDTNNGLYFNDFYLPEEVVTIILSYIQPKQILEASLVCKKWCNIIKSDTFWGTLYKRHYNKKPKKLPWYVYYCLFTTNYFDNVLKNGNGQNKYKYWTILFNDGDGFRIEDPPEGADPLPLDVPEFNGYTSCFATSFGECNKFQQISFKKSKLLQFIINKFKPHIYLSEWVAARFDCGCSYTLWCRLLSEPLTHKVTNKRRRHFRYRNQFDPENPEYFNSDFGEPLHVAMTGTTVEQWAGSTWSKIELLVKDYPSGVKSIIFQHQGVDTQFWKGHYGSKMAGGVLKLVFDSIQPTS